MKRNSQKKTLYKNATTKEIQELTFKLADKVKEAFEGNMEGSDITDVCTVNASICGK